MEAPRSELYKKIANNPDQMRGLQFQMNVNPVWYPNLKDELGEEGTKLLEEFIEENFDSDVEIRDIARALFIDADRISRVTFKDGKCPEDYDE
jgi:hypothetical protein